MIGLAIKIARQSLGLSASETARKAEISKSYLSEMENGERLPGYEILCSIAKACFVPASCLCRVAESLEAGEILPFTPAEFERAIAHHIRNSKGASA